MVGQAFFDLYEFSENEKVMLINAHLGGDARKFIQDEDLINIDAAKKLDKLLRGTFSNKTDWQNILLNMKQRPEEKIRAFSVRLKIAGRKCGFKGPSLDIMCVNCLKRGCALHLTNLLNNCLPQTPFDEMVEHATQYERRQEAKKGE